MKQVEVVGGNGMTVKAPEPGTRNVVLVIYDVSESEAERLLSQPRGTVSLGTVPAKIAKRAGQGRWSASFVDEHGNHRDFEPHARGAERSE